MNKLYQDILYILIGIGIGIILVLIDKFLIFQIVNSLYQDSNNSLPATDVKFSGGVIKLSMPAITEWQISQYQQVCIMI